MAGLGATDQLGISRADSATLRRECVSTPPIPGALLLGGAASFETYSKNLNSVLNGCADNCVHIALTVSMIAHFTAVHTIMLSIDVCLSSMALHNAVHAVARSSCAPGDITEKEILLVSTEACPRLKRR